MNSLTLSNAQYLIEILGTIAFAFSGVVESARRRLDAVGVCVVAFLAAFGGGTLRDILLDRRPFFWVQHSEQLWLVFGLVTAALFFMRNRHLEPTERAMQWPDALGMGLFAASGAQTALAFDSPALVAALMGTVTAVFGGVLRDIVCNDIPKVFRDHQPYAVWAFVAGWMIVAMDALGVAEWLALLLAAGTATLLRVLSVLFDWRLPAWRMGS